MSRFAHLSRGGVPVLVRPEDVRSIEPSVDDGGTVLFLGEGHPSAHTGVDEPPAVAGARIMAAEGHATVDDVEDAMGEVLTVFLHTLTGGADFRSEHEVRAAVTAAYQNLKDTVLKAAYVAEGKETR